MAILIFFSSKIIRHGLSHCLRPRQSSVCLKPATRSSMTSQFHGGFFISSRKIWSVVRWLVVRSLHKVIYKFPKSSEGYLRPVTKWRFLHKTKIYSVLFGYRLFHTKSHIPPLTSEKKAPVKKNEGGRGWSVTGDLHQNSTKLSQKL